MFTKEWQHQELNSQPRLVLNSNCLFWPESDNLYHYVIAPLMFLPHWVYSCYCQHISIIYLNFGIYYLVVAHCLLIVFVDTILHLPAPVPVLYLFLLQVLMVMIKIHFETSSLSCKGSVRHCVYKTATGCGDMGCIRSNFDGMITQMTFFSLYKSLITCELSVNILDPQLARICISKS